MLTEEDLSHLSEMQQQVAKTTHALCDLLDVSRKIHPRFRLAVLRKVELYLLDQGIGVGKIKDMKPYLKRRPTKIVLKEAFKKNVPMQIV